MNEEPFLYSKLLAKPPFEIILHVHDNIWKDRYWPIEVRLKATAAVWKIVCFPTTDQTRSA